MNGSLSVRAAIIAVAFCSLALGQAQAAGVPLVGAESTYTRIDGLYTAANAIDGTTAGPFGWALDAMAESFVPQAAMFTPGSPVNAANLHFGMYFTTCCGEHQINDFRISVTDDSVPQIAGGNWVPLNLNSLVRQSGGAIVNVGDNRVRAVGFPPTFDTYSVSAALPIADVTGFRLETLPYDRRGQNIVANGSAGNGNFVLSEFTIDDATPVLVTPPTNWAVGAATTSNSAQWPGFPVTNITDGNRATLTHSHDTPPPPVGYHYDINLGQHHDIDQIAVYPRQGACCPERLTQYRVSIHDDLGGSIGDATWSADLHTDGSNPGIGPPDLLTAALDPLGTFAGQWIRIESLQNPVPNYSLQIAEVEVYGEPLVPPPSVFNVALGKTVTGDTEFGYGTTRAVDGSTGTFTHSNNFVPAFLQVDLEGIFDLTHIELVNRGDGCCAGRLNGATVTVFDENFDALFVSDVISGAGVGQVFTYDNGGTGFDRARYIRVDQTMPHADSYLSVAELRAFGVQVPEPSSVGLVAMGVIALAGYRLRRRK